MTPAPILLCPGGYEVLADEAGNRAQAGYLALARLADQCDKAKCGGHLAILFDVVRWAEEFHSRLVCCPHDCSGCAAARELAARKGQKPEGQE